MPIELKLLVWSVAIAFVQMLISVCGATLELGLPRLADNREGLPDPTGWAGRARRAYFNMLEGLLLFASLVLIAVVAQRTNATTALGAELFFGARLVYVVIYLAGIPWLRTAVWGVSIVGLLMIFSQLT